jgi:hypothetical protein
MAPFLTNHIDNNITLIKFPSFLYGNAIIFKWTKIIGEENLASRCFNFLTIAKKMAI